MAMKVEDIMTKDVSSCNPGTNAAVVAEIMWAKGCGAVPVVEDGGRVVGIVTDRDLFIALGTQNRKAADLSLGEIMHRDPSLCAPSDDVRAALKTMAQAHVHRLPVVDREGALRGILSIDDIVPRAETEGLGNDVLRALKAISPQRDYLAAA
jgi:CBS domain-containing protein